MIMGIKQPISLPSIASQVTSEAEAYVYLEQLRWADGVVCPHCGGTGHCFYLSPDNGVSRKTRTGTTSQRRVWKCGDCRKQFSVLTGTTFHGTKISVRTWLMVIFEMCSARNGISAREVERKYELTAKTAWFMCHRIREAMKREPLAGLLPGTVASGEMWVGGNLGQSVKEAARPTARAGTALARWEDHSEPVAIPLDPEEALTALLKGQAWPRRSARYPGGRGRFR